MWMIVLLLAMSENVLLLLGRASSQGQDPMPMGEHFVAQLLVFACNGGIVSKFYNGLVPPRMLYPDLPFK